MCRVLEARDLRGMAAAPAPCPEVEPLRRVATALQADIDAVRGSAALAALGDALTPAAGYIIQRYRTAIRLARGEELVGYKVGCTSAKVQAAFGISGPIHGRLWAGEQQCSPGGPARVPQPSQALSPSGFLSVSARTFVGLAIEGELAVVLVDTPGDDVSEWTVEYFPVRVIMQAMFQASIRATSREI